MDIDDVISRHRRRLDEHRKFLDHSVSADAMSSHGPTSPDAKSSFLIRDSYTTDDTPFSPNPVKPKEAEAEAADSHQTPSALNRYTPPKPPKEHQSHPNAVSVPTWRAAAHPRRCAEREARNASAPVDAMRRVGSVGFLGYSGVHERLAEEDREVDQQLRALGRYYADAPPDAMYARSKRWLESRERMRQQQIEERRRSAAEECSFRPHCEVLGDRLRRTRSAHAVSQFREDPSVASHLERLEEARQQRSEAERRLAGTNGSNWSNTLTVPQEFTFSRKVVAIPALRKPISVPVSLHKDHNMAEERTSDGLKQTVEEPNQGICDETRGSEGTLQPVDENLAATNPNTAQCGRTDRSEGMNTGTTTPRDDASQITSTQDTTTPTPRRRSRSAQNDAMEQIARLQHELSERDRELQEQQSEMSLLRRELDVAKATIRRLTLRDAPEIIALADVTDPQMMGETG